MREIMLYVQRYEYDKQNLVLAERSDTIQLFLFILVFLKTLSPCLWVM